MPTRGNDAKRVRVRKPPTGSLGRRWKRSIKKMRAAVGDERLT